MPGWYRPGVGCPGARECWAGRPGAPGGSRDLGVGRTARKGVARVQGLHTAGGEHGGVCCVVRLDNPPESKKAGAACDPRGLSPPRAWVPYVIAGVRPCTGCRVDRG